MAPKSNERPKGEDQKEPLTRPGVQGVAGKNNVTEEDLKTLEGMSKNKGTEHERSSGERKR